MKTATALILAFGLFTLVRRRIVHVDLSFFLFLALVVLSAASISDSFIEVAAGLFGVAYAPLVVIMLALFILLCLVTLLAAYLTRLRNRQANLIRRMAALESALNAERMKSTDEDGSR